MLFVPYLRLAILQWGGFPGLDGRGIVFEPLGGLVAGLERERALKALALLGRLIDKLAQLQPSWHKAWVGEYNLAHQPKGGRSVVAPGRLLGVAKIARFRFHMHLCVLEIAGC